MINFFVIIFFLKTNFSLKINTNYHDVYFLDDQIFNHFWFINGNWYITIISNFKINI